MVKAKPRDRIHVVGNLIANPRESPRLSTYPYGGVEVGSVVAVALVSRGETFDVFQESTGEISLVLEPDNRWVFGLTLRGWDNDAVEILLRPGHRRGQLSQHAGFHVPGNTNPGASTGDRSISLLLVANNRLRANSIMLYRGIPKWSPDAELAFARGSEHALPMAIECLRDGRDNILHIARLADITV